MNQRPTAKALTLSKGFTILVSFLLCIFVIQISHAQNTGVVRGNVYDAETGSPIMFGNVLVKGTNLGAVTDEKGFFSISEVPVGKQELVIRYIGYDSLAVGLNLRAGQIGYEKHYLTPSGVKLETVNVTGKKEIAQTEVTISKLSVTTEEIKLLPSTSGDPDIAQYLPVLPGIVFTGDQGGQLFIRGGTPIQNKILLDGMIIYNPFHSIGFFSVFETEAVRNIDVYTAGFGAEYGSRTSAIVDIRTRDGNANEFGGLISANPFQAKVLLEGPLARLDQSTGRSISYLVTGKRSFIDQTSKTLYEYASDSTGLPFFHQDIYGKISFAGGNGSKLDVFGFNFTDNVDFQNVAEIDWSSSGGGLNFSLIPRANNMVVNGKFNLSGYDISIDEGGDDEIRESSINGYEIGLNFNYFGNNRELNYGFELSGFNTVFDFTNFQGIGFSEEQNTTEIGAFVSYRQVIGGLVIEPGLRFQYYNAQGTGRVEPRVGVKYNLTDNIRLKAGGGLYSQNFLSTSNDRDVVNLFYGFLTGPEEELQEPGSNEPLPNNLQLSRHAVLGVELDIGDFTTINIEPFIKEFTQIANLNRNKQELTDPDYITETGDARGVDFSLKYDNNRTYIWATYSYAKVERDDGDQIYPTNFDRRHNANLLVSYELGKNRDWEASARWNLGSGFPFTLTQGFYGDYAFNDGVNTDVTTENPDLGIIYDEEINAGRLPYYHRLDFTLKRSFVFGGNKSLDVTASVTNAYDRNNIFFFDRVEFERVDQLPIIPSLGLVFKF
jgi:hypothetical protein